MSTDSPRYWPIVNGFGQDAGTDLDAVTADAVAHWRRVGGNVRVVTPSPDGGRPATVVGAQTIRDLATAGQPDTVTVTLSAHAFTMLCGLVAPSWEVHHDGIVGPGDEWTELRAAFPLDHFRAHAHTGDPAADVMPWDTDTHGSVGYDENAGQ